MDPFYTVLLKHVSVLTPVSRPLLLLWGASAETTDLEEIVIHGYAMIISKEIAEMIMTVFIVDIWTASLNSLS